MTCSHITHAHLLVLSPASLDGEACALLLVNVEQTVAQARHIRDDDLLVRHRVHHVLVHGSTQVAKYDKSALWKEESGSELVLCL